MTSRVSERGQLTIDPIARKQLNVRPGMIAYQRVVSGHLEIVFLPAPHHRSLAGVLHREDEEVQVRTSEDLEAAVQEAVAAETESQQADGA